MLKWLCTAESNWTSNTKPSFSFGICKLFRWRVSYSICIFCWLLRLELTQFPIHHSQCNHSCHLSTEIKSKVKYFHLKRNPTLSLWQKGNARMEDLKLLLLAMSFALHVSARIFLSWGYFFLFRIHLLHFILISIHRYSLIVSLITSMIIQLEETFLPLLVKSSSFHMCMPKNQKSIDTPSNESTNEICSLLWFNV